MSAPAAPPPGGAALLRLGKDVVIIRVTRSCGFAGGEENLGELDTGKLDGSAAARVQNLVAELERLAARAQAIGADLFRYDVDIEDDQGGQRHLVLIHEGDPGIPLPEPLAQLLRALEERR